MLDTRILARLAASAAIILPVAPALAQQPPAGDAPAASATPAALPKTDTGDIVVTARFRGESLRKVPIAITAISGASLASRQLNNVEAISASVPSLNFRTGQSNKDRTIFIRGIGTITTSPGVEASVSTVLDGVVLTRPGQSTLDLGEVERIEVLRGPQGTLFGKNASAGVVNIVTRDPTDKTEAFGEVGGTTDREYRIKGGVSGAIIPGTLKGLITGLYDDFAGNTHNLALDRRGNASRRYGVRGKLVFTPTDTLKITAIGDYVHTHETTAAVYLNTTRTAYPTNVTTNSVPLATVLASEGITASASNRDFANDTFTYVNDRNYGASLTALWTLGDYQITSISAYRWWKNHQRPDFDGLSTLTTAFPSGVDNGYVNSRQFSQEVRLTSPKGGLIDYVVGAYYLRGKTDEVYSRALTFLSTAGTTSTVSGIAHYGVKDDNYAVFGEANLNFTDHFRGIAGYRSTWDDLSFYHVRTSTNDPTDSGASSTDVTGIRGYHSASGDTSQRGDSYRVGLQYDLSSRAQTYFTASRGYKGPAYNVYFNMRSLNATTPLDEIALKPETSQSFEIGLKGTTADHAFSYSLAVFNTTFHGYQANFTDTVGGAAVARLINAGTVRTRGVEADVTLRPTKGFTVDISGAYTDATVRKFNCPVGAPVSCDINGEPLPFAPKLKLYTNAAYQFALTDRLSAEIQSDVNLISKTQFQLNETPDTVQPSYAIWNASIALLSPSSGWQLRAYVKNIANQHYAAYIGQGTYAGNTMYVPRDDVRYGGLLLRKEF